MREILGFSTFQVTVLATRLVVPLRTNVHQQLDQAEDFNFEVKQLHIKYLYEDR